MAEYEKKLSRPSADTTAAQRVRPQPAKDNTIDTAVAGPRTAAQRRAVEDVGNSPRVVQQRARLAQIGVTDPTEPTVVPSPNRTGLPDALKSGVEDLSGLSMDHVRVHFNSARPAQLNAHAYAQGHDIHLATGQERHLPHEAWHVVQQARGRVPQTAQLDNGTPVNTDPALEREADVMGDRALSADGTRTENGSATHSNPPAPQGVVQCYFEMGPTRQRVDTVPKLYRIEGNIELHNTLRKWATDPDTKHEVIDWDDAIDAAIALANLGKQGHSLVDDAPSDKVHRKPELPELLTSLANRGVSLDALSEKLGGINTSLRSRDMDATYRGTTGQLYELYRWQKQSDKTKGYEVVNEAKAADSLYKHKGMTKAVQHKLVTGTSWVKRLREALEQLTGVRGETPPKGAVLVADIAMDYNASSSFVTLAPDTVQNEVKQELDRVVSKRLEPSQRVEVKLTYLLNPGRTGSEKLIFGYQNGTLTANQKSRFKRRPELNQTVSDAQAMRELAPDERTALSSDAETVMTNAREAQQFAALIADSDVSKFLLGIRRYLDEKGKPVPKEMLNVKTWDDTERGKAWFGMDYLPASRAFDALLKAKVIAWGDGVAQGIRWMDALPHLLA